MRRSFCSVFDISPFKLVDASVEAEYAQQCMMDAILTYMVYHLLRALPKDMIQLRPDEESISAIEIGSRRTRVDKGHLFDLDWAHGQLKHLAEDPEKDIEAIEAALRIGLILNQAGADKSHINRALRAIAREREFTLPWR